MPKTHDFGAAPPRFRRKGSLVVSVALLYLTLTLTNLLIFWFAAGSDQINLIAENSVLAGKSTGFELLRRLAPLAEDKAIQSTVLLAEKIRQAVQKPGADLNISDWALLDGGGKPLFPAETKPYLSEGKILKAIQAHEYFGQPFIVMPDLLGSVMYILIPLQVHARDSVVFAAKIPSLSIRRRIDSLVRFGLIMSGALLFAQAVFGWILYRRYARPILQLVRSTLSFTRRNFFHRSQIKRSDEIGYLDFSFNRMAKSAFSYNQRLQATLTELRSRQDQLEFDLELGGAIQSAIMPAHWENPLAEIMVFFRPLEHVSGDYYDFVNYADGKLGVLLTDAMGHGVPAALLTIMAKIHFSNLHSPEADPAALLSGMHHQLKKIPLDSNYLTALYFLLKPDLTFQYAVACHMPGVLFRRNTGEISLLQGRGFLLGMEGPEVMDSISGQVASGDRILFFTDGLVEPSDESSSVFGTVQEVFLTSAHLPLTDCYEYLILNLINPNFKTTDDITFILMEIR